MKDVQIRCIPCAKPPAPRWLEEFSKADQKVQKIIELKSNFIKGRGGGTQTLHTKITLKLIVDSSQTANSRKGFATVWTLCCLWTIWILDLELLDILNIQVGWLDPLELIYNGHSPSRSCCLS